jgi:ABC-type branched-subunit amino acid transport system substrate-binding protein
VLILAACTPAGSSTQSAPTQGAVTASEIKVGAVLPLTGAFSASGNYFQQA